VARTYGRIHKDDAAGYETRYARVGPLLPDNIAPMRQRTLGTRVGARTYVCCCAVAGATATRRAIREARRSRSHREGEDQLAGDIDLFDFIGTEEARGNVLAASESESLDRASEC